MVWTRVTDPDEAQNLLPAWLGRRLVGLHGRFGLLLPTGDIMRIKTVTAVHQSTDGEILLDVALDSAGVPEGVDEAWRPKHFLGMPVPGATAATVNLAQVVAAVEFVADVSMDMPGEKDAPTCEEVVSSLAAVAHQIQHEGASSLELPTQGAANDIEVSTLEKPVKTKKLKKKR